ncbi:glyoxalase [Algoriphagus aestuarii]|nr:glyoxalase [Algoriphagus aestuarii]
MIHPAKSIRTFIGSKNFEESTRFYQTLGFQVKPLSKGFSLITVKETICFYLQDYYSKEWCENTMVFLEVENLESYWEAVKVLGLPEKFKGVKLSSIKNEDWGSEFFLHDPAGILWHFGVFS